MKKLFFVTMMLLVIGTMTSFTNNQVFPSNSTEQFFNPRVYHYEMTINGCPVIIDIIHYENGSWGYAWAANCGNGSFGGNGMFRTSLKKGENKDEEIVDEKSFTFEYQNTESQHWLDTGNSKDIMTKSIIEDFTY